MAAEGRGIEVRLYPDEQVALVDLLSLLDRQVDDFTGHFGADLHLHHGLELAAAGHYFREVATLNLLGSHRHRLLAVAARTEQGGGRKQREDVAMRHLQGMETVRRGVSGRIREESRSVRYASNLSQIGHWISEIFGMLGSIYRLRLSRLGCLPVTRGS